MKEYLDQLVYKQRKYSTYKYTCPTELKGDKRLEILVNLVLSEVEKNLSNLAMSVYLNKRRVDLNTENKYGNTLDAYSYITKDMFNVVKSKKSGHLGSMPPKLGKARLGPWKNNNRHLEKECTNKWEFKAQDSSLIDFDKIAKDLDAEHPIIFVDHGKTDSYVVICMKFFKKALAVQCPVPNINTAFLFSRSPKERYLKYGVTTNFGEWIDWARKVKASSWPTSDRKDNIVRVSRPQI